MTKACAKSLLQQRVHDPPREQKACLVPRCFASKGQVSHHLGLQEGKPNSSSFQAQPCGDRSNQGASGSFAAVLASNTSQTWHALVVQALRTLSFNITWYYKKQIVQYNLIQYNVIFLQHTADETLIRRASREPRLGGQPDLAAGSPEADGGRGLATLGGDLTVDDRNKCSK